MAERAVVRESNPFAAIVLSAIASRVLSGLKEHAFKSGSVDRGGDVVIHNILDDKDGRRIDAANRFQRGERFGKLSGSLVGE